MKQIISAVLLACTGCFAQLLDFEKADVLQKLAITGSAQLEAAPAERGGNALRIDPKSRVIWKLRDETASGKVSFWVYDDCTVADNPKTSQAGPRWGVIQANGRVLTAGAFYAKYLTGAETYSVSESDQKNWFSPIQYIGEKRQAKWRQWTFDFSPDSGCTMSLDGTPIKRFDWNKTQSAGFTGVAFFGDDSLGSKLQTLWVDDVSVTLGGPMNVKATPPPPPPPVLPEKDPEISAADVPKLKTELHPRLIVTPATLPALKAFYNSEKGKPFRESFLSYLGSSQSVPSGTPKFLKDATEGQRQGLWRMPTVALHYLLTGDKKSLDAAVGNMKWLLEQPVWESGEEVNSGMSAANVMIGAALSFDWLYNDLDPEFREAFRQKLWYQARYMYHGGHLMKTPGTHYWQNDPQANHRWHRDAGLALCVLAAYTGQSDQGWLLEKTKEELEFIVKWLPEDGTSHESASYLIFGAAHLTLALQAADECLGTRFLENEFYAHVPGFIISSCLPGSQKLLPYGDTGGGLGDYKAFLFKATAVHKEGAEQQVLFDLFQQDPGSFFPAWLGLVWFDPNLPMAGGQAAPLNSFWSDIGVTYMRTGWTTNDAAAMFKCGPLGGYKLNRFRNENNFSYINVAHDDPDANSFVLFNHGELLAETDRYSHAKRSSNYNTILVGGMGQMVPGRMEPQVYSQPGGQDMTQMAVVTALRDTGDVLAVEGEAAGSYLSVKDKKTGKTRPALERFRRTFIWIKGGYVLVLDDVRSTQPTDLTWLMQSGGVKTLNESEGRYSLEKGKAVCEFQVVADSPFSAVVGDSTADNRQKPLGWKQLQATAANTQSIRFVSVYDLWSRGPISVNFVPDGSDQWKVSVKGGKINDIWTWQAAAGRFDASTLTATHAGEKEPFFIMNKGNAASTAP